MKNLLRKEIILGLEVRNFISLLFAAMMCIPNYPRYVGAFFFCVSVFTIFGNAQANKDLDYAMTLPITKKDMVKSRCLLCGVYEAVAILISVPFAVLFNVFVPMTNEAGIEGNVACYGFMLILITIFNFILFTGYYKKAEKPAVYFLVAAVVYWVAFMIVEMPIYLKDILQSDFVYMLDSIDAKDQIRQLPILAVGLAVFLGGWVLTYKVSAKRFEKVDL